MQLVHLALARSNYASPRVIDLGWALLIGVIAGLIGTLYKLIFGVVHLVFTPLNKRPVVRAVVGGIVIGLIGSFLPGRPEEVTNLRKGE